MRIYRSSFIWWGILVLILALFPIPFAATSAGSQMPLIALMSTASAGKTGAVAVVVITCLFYIRLIPSKRKKAITFFRSFFILVGLIASLAWLNEHAIKSISRSMRPGHELILSLAGADTQTLETFSQMGSSDRAIFLSELVEKQRPALLKIDSEVIDHWIEEPGYSFPSGHAFNAFLLAGILAFSLKFSRSKTANKFYLLPFCWAVMVGVSRVSLGAHTSVDVIVGALFGLLIGNLLLSYEPSRRLIMHRAYSPPEEAR